MNIDGTACAAALNAATRDAVSILRRNHDLSPGLAVVIVGQDPASHVYVRNKVRQAEAAGLRSILHALPESVSAKILLDLIAELNASPDVHGILVQLPLPSHIQDEAVIAAISPEKDVDGFHPLNSGGLLAGDRRALVPCTPQGCLILARQAVGTSLAGKHAVVVGRSNIVGKPLAMLLLQADCTVTVTHSHSRDLESICRQADLLFVAVGRPEMVKAAWVRPGAIVIDVGINRLGDPESGYRLVGDVDFQAVRDVASAITPVPGGVGPMTIACLLRNTVLAACHQNGLSESSITLPS